MSVNKIGSFSRLDPIVKQSGTVEEKNGKENLSFARVLKDALDKVNETQLEAQKLARDFTLGKVENIHTVTIAAQKAELALDLTLAIRNKVIEAYKELMRMQF